MHCLCRIYHSAPSHPKLALNQKPSRRVSRSNASLPLPPPRCSTVASSRCHGHVSPPTPERRRHEEEEGRREHAAGRTLPRQRHRQAQRGTDTEMPHRTRPMAALLLFTGLNVVLVSTITPVYDFVCFLPYWERRRERRRLEREAAIAKGASGSK